jgi:hypothetical protein
VRVLRPTHDISYGRQHGTRNNSSVQ